jgi:hypothetical protein
MAPNTMAAGYVYVVVMVPLNWDLQQREYVISLGGSKRETLILLCDSSHSMA